MEDATRIGVFGIGFKLFDPNGAFMIRYGATVLQLNQWVHVAGVYDAAAQTMAVYLNGVADNGTLLGTVAGMQLNSTLDLFIGRRADTAGQYNFNGTIDEVRLYNRALSQAEIQADMNTGLGSTSPVALYFIQPDPLNTPRVITKEGGYGVVPA
ncbi:MAG: LamG domain-containing protein [Betaproteobacteria bacterium]|nr:LamG domain-containing protein [Betaproteobacteria bacterium]